MLHARCIIAAITTPTAYLRTVTVRLVEPTAANPAFLRKANPKTTDAGAGQTLAE
ncbi:hypothetical protein M413DRAFT_32636 [Hebeloma cylindrosporum]|uniref:Uncharacterized protein n=1 Tax=Hebeloma cylindrosporum TaxID=76867 RepID=A0A0C2XB95_HEBCY|nr:hypothetical protein M413DRAFT_32636 [Hebeloma cylindrosporum h7]